MGASNVSRRIPFQRKFHNPFTPPYKVNIGGGNVQHQQTRDKEHGYLVIDILDEGQDVIWDIEEGIPLPDNSCSQIYCSHVVEHVDDMIGLMNEFWRILQSDGVLYVVCPHITSDKAYILTHIRRLNEQTFQMFDYKFQTETDWKKGYNIYPWEVCEIIVNDRHDIHFKAQPHK